MPDQATIPALRDLIPEGTPGREGVLAKYSNPADLAKAYYELTQLHRTAPRVPGPNATPEQILEFHRAMGAPETPAGYERPAGVDADPLFEKFRTAAHELGITQKQFPKLAELLKEAKLPDPSPRWAAEAKERWGPKFDENLAIAQRGVERLSATLPGLKAALEETKAGNHPEILELMLLFGRRMQNDTTPISTATGGMTDDAARKLAAEWRKLVASPATDSRAHPEYETTVDRIREIRASLKAQGYDTPDDPKLAPLTHYPTPR